MSLRLIIKKNIFKLVIIGLVLTLLLISLSCKSQEPTSTTETLSNIESTSAEITSSFPQIPEIIDFNQISGLEGSILFTVKPYYYDEEGSISIDENPYDNVLFNVDVKSGDGKVVLDETQLIQPRNHIKVYNKFFAISPDGTKLAYFDAQSNLCLLDTKSGETNSLVTALGYDFKFISWAPDSSKIAFLNNGDLYVIDPTGDNLKRVVQHEVHNYTFVWSKDDTLLTPTWLADCKTILYNRQLHESDYPSRDMEIYKVDIETSEIQSLIEGWKILDNHWQGGILVQEYAADNSLLRRLDETGATLNEFGRLPFGEEANLIPHISNDGKKLAFVYGLDGISIMTLTSGQQVMQTLNLPDIVDTTITWSPDGQCIGAFNSEGTFWVFNSSSGASAELFKITGDVKDVSTVWVNTKITAAKPTPTVQISPPPIGSFVFVSDQEGSDDDSSNNYDIFLMNKERSSYQNLTSNSFYDDWPSVSPDGSKIAFLSARFDTDNDGEVGYSDSRELYVMNIYGSNQTRITNMDGAIIEAPLRWSPDGSLIAFTAIQTDQTRFLSVISADGSLNKQLASNINKWTDFTWAPDSKRIAFGGDEITIAYTDGKPITYLISSCDYPVFDPAWSPDGSKIAFVGTGQPSDQFPIKNDEIRIMNSDGSGETLILDSLGAFDDGRSSLCWSSDSKKIAFQSFIGDRSEMHDRSFYSSFGNTYLYVIDRDGINVSFIGCLGGSALVEYTATWLPNSDWLMLNSDFSTPNESSIFIVRSNGTGLTQLIGSDDHSYINPVCLQ